MVVQSRFLVVRIFVHQTELRRYILNALVHIVLHGVADIERLCHIQPVQPHLMRVDFLVPETAFLRPRMLRQLHKQTVIGQFPALVRLDVVQHIQERTAVHAVYIEIMHLVRLDIALVIDKLLGKLQHVVEISIIARSLIGLQHRFRYQSLSVVPFRCFHIIGAPQLRIMFHLARGEQTGIRKVIRRFVLRRFGKQAHRTEHCQ